MTKSKKTVSKRQSIVSTDYAKFVTQLKKKIRSAQFIEGFSKTNMGRMRAFYLAYSISPQAVGKLEELPIFNIPWGRNIAFFEGVKSLNPTIGILICKSKDNCIAEYALRDIHKPS